MIEEPKEEQKPSKSQKKREAHKLQEIGVALVALSLAKLDALPLTDELRQAILEAKRLKSHGAIRRQSQLIGKLMLRADSQAIIEAYEGLKR
jgi:ribosome-associated protein